MGGIGRGGKPKHEHDRKRGRGVNPRHGYLLAKGGNGPHTAPLAANGGLTRSVPAADRRIADDEGDQTGSTSCWLSLASAAHAPTLA
jgi:hypothetical protein